MLDSLVRVSRRADYDHYASILAEARTSPGARCITRGYNTPEGATFLKSYPAAPDDAGLQRGEWTGQKTGGTPRASLVAIPSLLTISRAF